MIRTLLPQQILRAPFMSAIQPRVKSHLKIRVEADRGPAVRCNRRGAHREGPPAEQEQSAQTAAIEHRPAGFPDTGPAAEGLAGAPFWEVEFCRLPYLD
jgi:hypothetical protein